MIVVAPRDIQRAEAIDKLAMDEGFVKKLVAQQEE